MSGINFSTCMDLEPKAESLTESTFVQADTKKSYCQPPPPTIPLNHPKSEESATTIPGDPTFDVKLERSSSPSPTPLVGLTPGTPSPPSGTLESLAAAVNAMKSTRDALLDFQSKPPSRCDDTTKETHQHIQELERQLQLSRVQVATLKVEAACLNLGLAEAIKAADEDRKIADRLILCDFTRQCRERLCREYRIGKRRNESVEAFVLRLLPRLRGRDRMLTKDALEVLFNYETIGGE